MTKKQYSSTRENTKKILSLLLFFLCLFGTVSDLSAQVIELFSENMGTTLGSGNPSPAQHDTSSRFQNSANYDFSGSSDMRDTDVSSGYTDSSGGNNVMINAIGENFIIDGFDLSEYKNIMLYFGLRVGAAAATSQHFKVYYSTTGSGGTWIEIPMDISGPYNWRIVSTTTASYVPNDATALKFERASGGTGGWVFRIDDIRITGELDCELPATPAGTVATVGSVPFCGNSISFSYSGATAPSGIAFFWQSVANGESTAFPLASNPTFTLTGTGARTAYLRARRTDGGCWSAGNKSATATVYAIPGITIQPINRFIGPNTNTTFSATTSGTVTSRQWQISTDNGATWQNLTNTAPYTGATTATLAITNATTALHQNQYRMIASNNGCSTESNAAILSITGLPAITSQPAIEYTSCNSATIALTALNVLGTTADLTYTWYAFYPTTNDWSVITNNIVYDGATTPTLTINSLVDLNDTQYYVRVNYKNQSCYSASRTVKATVVATASTRWDGTSWTNVTPDENVLVILDQDYDTATANLTACSIDLNGKTITINENEFVRVLGNITGTGTINIRDSGSLVQVQDGVTNGTQWTLEMERISKPMYRYDFTYWSSPLFANDDPSDDTDAVLAGAEFNLKQLSPMTFFDKYYKWGHAGAGWITIPVGVESMVPGRGYIVRAPQSHGADASDPASYENYTANFIGKTNNGIIRHAVSGGADEWNLLGNPYPSAISANSFFDANVGNANGSTNTLEGTIYLWTHNTKISETGTPHIYTYSAGDYAAYNGTGSTNTKEAENDPTPDDDEDNLPTGFIAAGQSFFIKGTAAGEAVFNNSMRIAGNNNQFFKPAPTEPLNNWDITGKHRLWLNMKGQTKGFSQLLVGYVPNATNDFDIRFDGESFGGNQVTFYSLMTDKKLTIQGRALPFNNQDQVPLGYKSTLNGNLTISLDQYDGLFEGQDVYLEDKLLNIVHDLKASAYSFASTVGTFNERFILRYLPSSELSNPDHEALANGLIVYQEEGKIMIKSQLEDMSQVIVYDLLGRIVFDQNNIAKRDFSIQNVVMNEQVLIIKITLENGATLSKKIVY